MGITSKIIGERGRRQAEKRGLDPSRVPPGQYLTERFPVLTYGPNPPFDRGDWSLSVDGEVAEPFSLGWDELLALEQVTLTTDIHCVTRWSKLDTTWTGVRVRDLFDRARVKPSGTHVLAHSDGGYTTNVPLDGPARRRRPRRPHLRRAAARARPRRAAAAARPEALLLEVREVPAPPRGPDGGPPGFWELNGYHNDGDPWREQRHWF